jgi:uncharacterized protein (DUF305 family)
MAVAAVALALVIAVCAGLLIGSRVVSGSPSGDSVDAGFARDMQIHHAQAVEMAYAVTLQTEDPAVRTIAFDILTSQQAQIGRMSAWLDRWDLPTYSSEPLMRWMDHGGDDGHDMADMTDDGGEFVAEDGAVMPGMATDTEMQQLRSSTGRQAEILFLELMVDHHRGGVSMASYAAEHASEEEVRLAADRMATAQAAEVRAMNDMLLERGAEPV